MAELIFAPIADGLNGFGTLFFKGVVVPLNDRAVKLSNATQGSAWFWSQIADIAETDDLVDTEGVNFGKDGI
jgi:hypothetical protein